MFNRILILRGVIEIGNSDVGRFVVKKNMMVIDYYTILSMISSEILIYTFKNFSQFNFLISTSQFTMPWQILLLLKQQSKQTWFEIFLLDLHFSTRLLNSTE